jgi:hypothetical protein
LPSVYGRVGEFKVERLHFAGRRSYGTTKRGAYMCEKDAIETGMRAAKNETHP